MEQDETSSPCSSVLTTPSACLPLSRRPGPCLLWPCCFTSQPPRRWLCTLKMFPHNSHKQTQHERQRGRRKRGEGEKQRHNTKRWEEECGGILMCPNLNENNSNIITVTTCSVFSQMGWSTENGYGGVFLISMKNFFLVSSSQLRSLACLYTSQTDHGYFMCACCFHCVSAYFEPPIHSKNMCSFCPSLD